MSLCDVADDLSHLKHLQECNCVQPVINVKKRSQKFTFETSNYFKMYAVINISCFLKNVLSQLIDID